MNWHSIPFPDKNKLYQDYILNPERVMDFYAANPFESLQATLAQRLKHSFPRQELAAIFAQQHRQWGTTPAIDANIEQLKQPHSVAVVTGQQVGVLVSPMYTIYKIFTILQQARLLSTRYPDFSFIPVFWMEVDDNDFQEINHLHYIAKDNAVHRLELEENPEERGRPIFTRRLPASIQQWQEQLRNDFFPTEFMDGVLQAYFSEYVAGTPFATAFARMVVKIFGQYGLLVLNPSVPEVKQLGTAVFQAAIEKRQEILETFWKRNQLLEASGYHSQIHLKHDQTLIFWLDEAQRRVRLDCDAQDHCLLRYAGSNRTIAFQEILREIEQEPARFTTNVALRPIFQDWILPTGLYVGGPAEIAYFAQLNALYPLFNLSAPAILPRHRLTIVEKKIQKIAQKYTVDYRTLFAQNFHFLENDLKGRLAEHPITTRLQEIQQVLEDGFDQLKPEVAHFDPTLVKALEHTRQSIQQAIGKFNAKVQRAAENQDETRTRQLQRLLTYVFPRHLPQERVLAPIYFQLKYGWQFLDEVFQQLPEDVRSHWIVEL